MRGVSPSSRYKSYIRKSLKLEAWKSWKVSIPWLLTGAFSHLSYPMQDLQDQTSVDYKQNKTDTKAPEKVTYVQLCEGGARTKENGRKGSHMVPAVGLHIFPRKEELCKPWLVLVWQGGSADRCCPEDSTTSQLEEAEQLTEVMVSIFYCLAKAFDYPGSFLDYLWVT